MEDKAMTRSLCDEPFDSERELRNHQQTVHAAEMSNRRGSRDNEPEAGDKETAA
ncbi:MAG: hypothetical protein WCA13_06415 [Terriglobales bacterium]